MLLYPDIPGDSEEELKNSLVFEIGFWGNFYLCGYPRKLSPQGNFRHMALLLGQEWMPSQ